MSFDNLSTQTGSESSAGDDSSNLSTTELNGGNLAPSSEHMAAESAIAEAVQFANNAQAAGDAGPDARPVERKELSTEERRELARKTAKKQSKLGLAELERIYPSTIVIPRHVAISDTNIASSAQRFLGLVDRTLYTLNRYGTYYHTQSEVDKIREVLRELIDTYTNEADAAVTQAKLLADKAKEEAVDWLEPAYTTSTLDVEFGVKARDTLRVITGLETWDRAILGFAALEFNDTASIGQIDTMRQRERRLFMAISRMCLRTIGGLSKRRDTMAQAKAKPGASNEETA